MQTLIAGRELRLSKDAAGMVQTIDYDLDDRRHLQIERVGKRFLPGIVNYLFETRVAYAAGAIEDILIKAMEKAGEKTVLALALADLLSWDIDFNTELRVGDSFRLLFEKNYREGRFAGYGEILAAEFLCQGRLYEAYRFVYPDTGEADHFDAQGRSTRKEFLRAPIPFAPVTSRFSASRLHPIFKVYRAHFGVDYGAPIGTAVQATADGVVTAAGWNGGAGQMIRLRHANSYETMYMHLSRILVAVGERVKMGQAIGRVGSTGESTGPHLDYRILQGGVFIDPLGKRFDPVAPLRKEYAGAFRGEVAKYRALFEAPFRLF
jgi:murein DD-endopeptidase MepM/ murein hydrolase activator NlpD